MIGGRDVSGAVWVTVLFGQPGFLTVQSETALRIAARPMIDDPLALLRSTAAPVGLLAIDLGRRRQVRINGQATPLTDGDGGAAADRRPGLSELHEVHPAAGAR